MGRFDKLRFGTAGIPLSTEPRNTENGVAHVRTLGLDGMEMEFVHSVNVSEDKAPTIKDVAKKNDVTLTAHGSYYINLNAIEKPKYYASINRVLATARRCWECGGFSMVFHAAFYLKQEPKAVYSRVQQALQEITTTLRDEGNTIWVRPETTGKPTQFGDIDEVLQLSADVEGVMPCIDFSHLHARTNGAYNTRDEFVDVMTKVEDTLGKEGLHNMHIHLSGIAYGPKGEKNHLPLQESDMNYKELLQVWKEFKARGVVVCESPNIEQDALLLQKTFDGL